MAGADPRERLADPGTLLATTHEVDDGLCVRLRLARPSDAMRVREFLEGLSPETRQGRFHAALATVPDSLVRNFTFFDPRERLVVAATWMEGHREAIAGLADVGLLSTGVAELGLVVRDEQQDQGAGKLLTEVIASLAMQQGATHLRAELLEHNGAMLRLMERLGRTARTVEGGVTMVYVKLPAALRRAA